MISTNSKAVEVRYFFENISVEQGLSNVLVHSIVQDKNGFIWIATEEGLNRFDGYQMEVFRTSDKNSVSDNFIQELYCSNDGIIWIGTSSGGLNSYNPVAGKFHVYNHKDDDNASISSNVVRSIFEDGDGRLWVGTDGGGVSILNRKSGKFENNDNNVLPELILDIKKFGKRILFGTNKGLYYFDSNQNRFGKIDMVLKSGAVEFSVNSIVVDNFRKHLILGTDDGIYFLDKNYVLLKYYNTSTKSFVAGNYVSELNLVSRDILWVGTQSGLSIIELNHNKITNLKNDPAREGTINNNFVRTIFNDKMGNIWIGTAGGGINKYSPHKKRFYKLFHDPEKETSFSHNMTRSIIEDSDGTVWIGTMGGGLNAFVKNSGNRLSFTRSFTYLDNLSPNAITAIYEDRRGALWVGTWGDGIYRFPDYKRNFVNAQKLKSNPPSYHYTKKEGVPGALGSNIIQAIKEDSRGNLWVGSEAGLELFIRSNNTFRLFSHDPFKQESISNNRIQSNCIFEDVQGNLWVGTWNGLNKITAGQLNRQDIKNIKFIRYSHSVLDTNSLSDNRIISIYQNIDGVIWVGTYGGGVNKLEVVKTNNGRKEIFNKFTEADGLNSNVIYGILGDTKGNLWMSTTNGLCMFNPFTADIVNYTKVDGLQSNQFYWGASCKTSDGILFFGGINGLNYFDPIDLKDNEAIPDVYITDFMLFDHSITNSVPNEYFSESILFADKIRLAHDQNVFTISFVALDYTIPEKNSYEYKLEGYDTRWFNTLGKRKVSYNHIEPGKYVFRVRASNNDGYWNNVGAQINIEILPPFWKTLWFLIGIILLIGGVIFYGIYSYIRQLLAIERLRAKLAADLHDSIGASLTEISILSEVISSKLTDKSVEITNNLKLISKKSRQLVDEMSDIVWLVNPKRDSLYDLILRLEDTYSELLSYKGISFRSSNLKSLEKISLSMEQRQNLFLIFKEAINNSITHSVCSDIYLKVECHGKKVKMELNDNGKGFDVYKTDSVHRGNGMENMQKRALNLGGKLVVESVKGEGTKIIYEGIIN